MFSFIKSVSRNQIFHLGIVQKNGMRMKTFVRSRSASNGDKIDFYTKWFKKLDSDNDGYITTEEFTRGLKNMYRTSDGEKRIDKLVKGMDTDKKGLVDIDEFIKHLSDQPEFDASEVTVERMFNVYDRDGDGRINRAEVAATFLALGHELRESQVDSLMKEYDKDGDGLISLEEFKVSLLSHMDDDH